MSKSNDYRSLARLIIFMLLGGDVVGPFVAERLRVPGQFNGYALFFCVVFGTLAGALLHFALSLNWRSHPLPTAQPRDTDSKCLR